MKKRILIASVAFLLLSTYQIKNNHLISSKFKIKKIIIENNLILEEVKIKKNLLFLYQKNLFFLKKIEIKKKLDELNLIDRFEVKKIYPNKIKIKINEVLPIAVIQNKKKKKYFTNNGKVIEFIDLKQFSELPIVFGDEDNFRIFYNSLISNNFPIQEIKIFYYFDSNRWDIVTNKSQTIKLPSKNYIQVLKNFENLKEQANFEKYKIFDYRIKDQLILK